MTSAAVPSLDEVVCRIGAPPGVWVDNCLAVSSAILEAFPEVNGTLVQGKWFGKVVPNSHFYWLIQSGIVPEGYGICHWYIVLLDGSVLDATRWVFEGVDPYIYHGINDYYVADHDHDH